MKDTVTVHVIDSFHELVHVVLDAFLWEVVTSTFNGIIHIHLHQLENKRQSSSGLIIEDLIEFDDLRMRGQPSERLDLPQIIDLDIKKWSLEYIRKDEKKILKRFYLKIRI